MTFEIVTLFTASWLIGPSIETKRALDDQRLDDTILFVVAVKLCRSSN